MAASLQTAVGSLTLQEPSSSPSDREQGPSTSEPRVQGRKASLLYAPWPPAAPGLLLIPLASWLLRRAPCAAAGAKKKKTEEGELFCAAAPDAATEA